jgi:hypothetical protein
MVEQGVLDSFQTMWGPFPEPVMLIHKTRTILAVNDCARTMGIPTGSKCAALDPEGSGGVQCKSCKADLAFRTGKTVCAEESLGDKTIIGYWMPLKEVPDVYVHFGIGAGAAMLAAKGGSSAKLVNPS